MIGKDGKVKKERDALIMSSFIVLILAVSAVSAAAVYSEYIAVDDTRVDSGSSVTVDYVGTYYAYHGETGAVVFDTTLKSVGADESIPKADGFSKSSYSTFRFNVGSDEVLRAFENAVVGHKAGDRVRVHIPAGEGYNAPGQTVTVNASQVQVIPRAETMTLKQFEAAHEGADGKAVNAVITSVYGWPAASAYDVQSNTVTVYHNPVAGESYTGFDGHQGEVVRKVTAATSATVSFTYAVSGFVKVGSAGSDGFVPVQMIPLDTVGGKVYITAVKDADRDGIADSFIYKTVGERYNIDLFFEIRIVSVS